MKFTKLFLYLFIPLLIITIIVLTSFGRTLGSYFLEDDFGEVLYVSHIFSGGWHKVLTNFTGNYMEIPTMKVYRPCLLLSIIFDYALWKTWAGGYFITNILFLIGTALMLYLVLQELTKSWDKQRSVIFALSSAALFAANPLHCESTSLMVGRVDIICAFFYLLSLWCFVRKGESKNRVLSLTAIISFWIALLTKEMAVGLPIILSAVCVLLPSSIKKQSSSSELFTGVRVEQSLYHKLKVALSLTYPFWISLLLYFIIRYLALGTFVGGYTGSVGASQINHIFEKWTDIDSVVRIIFPLNRAVFNEHSIYHSSLFAIYIILLLLALARIFISGISRSWLVLITVWTLTCLAPIYQLWGLGLNLEGARFLFFLTIPISIVLPLLIFAPTHLQQGNSIVHSNNKEAPILVLGILALISLIALQTKITAKNNIPWIHAGKQTRALVSEGQKLAQSLNNDQKAILLGIPKEVDGAHIIYNGATFNFIMSPPFSKENYQNRFITFDPILFGNANLINTQRFKRELSSPNMAGLYVWQNEELRFKQLKIPAEKPPVKRLKPLVIQLPTNKNTVLPFTAQRGCWQLDQNNINISDCTKGAGVSIGPMIIDPFTYDFLEIEANVYPPNASKNVKVFWQCFDENNQVLTERSIEGEAPALSIRPSPNGKSGQIYRFALSRQWRWFTGRQINRLWLEFPPAQSIELSKIRLINDLTVTPVLSIINIQPDNTGVYSIDKEGFNLHTDTKHIEGCVQVKLEISKPNYFFDNFDSSNSQAISTEMTIKDPLSKVFLNSKLFSIAGFYQIRAIGLNKDGTIQGEWSDPITIRSQ